MERQPELRRSVLVVDDEKLIRWSLRERLEGEGYEVREAADGHSALEHLGRGDIDLVLLDFQLPDVDGLEVLRRAKQLSPSPVVILMTAHGSIDNAVEAIRLGAFEYVRKPFDLDELVLDVAKGLETVQLRNEVTRYQRADRAQFRAENLVGHSAHSEDLRRMVRRIAKSGAKTILLSGETGTGKGLVARALHYESYQSKKPFLHVNCTALPEALLESELFGHERGAFTDAKALKKGLIELAEGGTVFLDEIGDMPLAIQGKLLTFLEDKLFRRLGGVRDISVDVRIVAATHRVLRQEVERGAFRADLFYRLNVIPIHIEPLHERCEDVMDLVGHFVATYNEEFKKSIRGLDAAARQAFEAYSWPGNIRELKNALERAILLADSDVLGLADVPFEIREANQGAAHPEGGRFQLPAGGVDFEDVRRDLLTQALRRSHGNKTGTGKLLGLNRDQVRYWMRKYGLEEGEPVEAGDG